MMTTGPLPLPKFPLTLHHSAISHMSVFFTAYFLWNIFSSVIEPIPFLSFSVIAYLKLFVLHCHLTFNLCFFSFILFSPLFSLSANLRLFLIIVSLIMFLYLSHFKSELWIPFAYLSQYLFCPSCFKAVHFNLF